MTDEEQPTRITRESLRDGTLIELARRRMAPGMRVRTDAEIEQCLAAMLLGQLPREPLGDPLGDPRGNDVWLFGYGSLMWNPAMHFTEHRGGRVVGWHRKYCLWLEAGRGTPENPGLMLALDRGGAAAGALFRVSREELLLPFRRELFTYSYEPRWVSVATREGPVRAITFVVNRNGPRYVHRLDLDLIARHVGTASGGLGSCLEYLRRTLESLDALGLDDRMMREVFRICATRAAGVSVC
jgi:cation transport protein ChaC